MYSIRIHFSKYTHLYTELKQTFGYYKNRSSAISSARKINKCLVSQPVSKNETFRI